jgi:hypothetical protein
MRLHGVTSHKILKVQSCYACSCVDPLRQLNEVPQIFSCQSQLCYGVVTLSNGRDIYFLLMLNNDKIRPLPCLRMTNANVVTRLGVLFRSLHKM